LTESELDNRVWPVDTYASLLLLLPLGLLAEGDLLGYRGVILLGVLCRQATRVLLLFGSGLGAMQAMQVTYAAATSCEAVYLAYPFVAVHPVLFLPASVAVRAAVHLGNAVGSAVGQTLVSFWPGMPLKLLFWLSWAFATAGLLAVAALPPPRSTPRSLWRRPAAAPPPPAAKGLAGAVRFLPFYRRGSGGSDGRGGYAPRLGVGWSGAAAVGVEVAGLYRAAGWGSALVGWSAWWVLGTAASQLFVNYYQTMVYDASEVRARCVERSLAVGSNLEWRNL
jgi:hypothetical protein